MADMTGYDYEYLWALYLKLKGYGVKVTKKSGDEGVDVIAIKNYRKIAYQCKLYYSKPVDRDAIYQVNAGRDVYKCSKAIVVTNGTFTAPAIETAKKLSVELLPNKSPESLIEACAQSYKEGNLNSKDELFMQLPVGIQKAITSGIKNILENANTDVAKVKSGETYDEDKISERPLIAEYNDIPQKQQIHERPTKICPICGRDFLECSVMCPICNHGLVSLEKNKIREKRESENKASVVIPVKSKSKKNKKLFYCCMGAAVFVYVCIFFMAILSSFEIPVHTEKIQVTVSSKDLKGNNYTDVVKTLQDAGFADIELIEDADLIMGLLKHEGEVGEVSINGTLSFEKNDYFPKDAKIKITYHTFKPEYQSLESNTDISQQIEENDYKTGKKTGIDIVSMPGHPVLFDTTEKGKQVWTDYLGKEVLLPGIDGEQNKSEKTIIWATGHSTWGMRLDHIDLYLYNTDTGSVDFNTALGITKQYLPIELMKQYYKLEESYIIEGDMELENEDFYIYHINYKITEEGYALREQTKEKCPESSFREYYSMPYQIYISLSGKDAIASVQIRTETYKSDRETYYEKNGLKKTEWHYDFLN